MGRTSTSQFDVRLRSSGNTTFVALSGELDLSTAPRLAEALDQVVGLKPEVVVVDLDELEFMDCTGLRVLLCAAGELDDADGGNLYVTRARCQVRKLFELTGTDQRLRVLPPSAVYAGFADAA